MAAAAVAEVLPDQGQYSLVFRVVLIERQVISLSDLGVEDQIAVAAVQRRAAGLHLQGKGDQLLQSVDAGTISSRTAWRCASVSSGLKFQETI